MSSEGGGLVDVVGHFRQYLVQRQQRALLRTA